MSSTMIESLSSHKRIIACALLAALTTTTALTGCSATRDGYDKLVGNTTKPSAQPVGARRAPPGNLEYMKQAGMAPQAQPGGIPVVPVSSMPQPAAPQPVARNAANPYDSYDAKGNLVAPLPAAKPPAQAERPFFDRMFQRDGAEEPHVTDEPKPQASARKPIAGNAQLMAARGQTPTLHKEEKTVADTTPATEKPGFFASWFDSSPASSAPEPVQPVVADAAPAQPGFFARVFDHGDAAPQPVKSPETAAEAASAEPEKPGFFTRMFHRDESMQVASAEPAPPAAPEQLKAEPYPALSAVPSNPPELKFNRSVAAEKTEKLEDERKQAEAQRYPLQAEPTPLTDAYNAKHPQPVAAPNVAAPAPTVETPAAETPQPEEKKSWWNGIFGEKAAPDPVKAQEAPAEPVKTAEPAHASSEVAQDEKPTSRRSWLGRVFTTEPEETTMDVRLHESETAAKPVMAKADASAEPVAVMHEEKEEKHVLFTQPKPLPESRSPTLVEAEPKAQVVADASGIPSFYAFPTSPRKAKSGLQPASVNGKDAMKPAAQANP